MNADKNGAASSASIGVHRRLNVFIQVSAIALALSAVADLFSIAICEILLGISIAAFLAAIATRQLRFEMPIIWIPLTLYMLWTVLSMFASPPVARHLPQLYKMWLLAILPVGYGVLRFMTSKWFIRGLVVVAALSCIWSGVQFARKYLHWLALHKDFYDNYQLDRVTGFKHHWMTFSGQLMMVLMLLAAWMIVEKLAKVELFLGALAAALIVTGLLLSFTRGTWLGSGAGIVYILWMHRRKWLIALPVLAALGYIVVPGFLQERVRAIVVNQNDHSAAARRLMYPTGWAMIKAHPLFGVGPEGVKSDFDSYRPDAFKPNAWYGHLHSDYLQTAASRGLPALAFLLCFFALVWRDLHRLAATSWLARGAAAASIAYYIEGVVEYNFGGSEVLMMWLFLVVWGYSVRNVRDHAKYARILADG